jgi:IS1 transposase
MPSGVAEGGMSGGLSCYACAVCEVITGVIMSWVRPTGQQLDRTYRRHLDPAQHTVGKQYTQKIERKHTTLRARIKRLVRKTICFSRSILMHDLVIGLFINRYEFRYAV